MQKFIVKLLLLAPLVRMGGIQAEPVVIVHPGCESSGDIELVRKIFLGKERTLCGGNSVQAVDVDEKNPLRPIFLDRVLGKNESQLRQYWSRLIFTGKAAPPRNVGDDLAVKNWVAQNKDSIGVIDSTAVDSSVKSWIKVQ